jgi:3-deoxy-D-manno-octulosonic-acid transferase
MKNSSGILHRIKSSFGALTAVYVKVVYHTTRFTNSPANPKKYSAQLGPVIVTSWHGQIMILPPFWHHQHPLEILVSRHRDVESIATAFKHLGLNVIRGSGSLPGKSRATKGGAEGLRQMVRALKRGSSVALVADVPTGPARRAGRGIIMLAQISGNPILPLAVTTQLRLVVNSWDRMAINLPLSRGSIAVGEPISVPRDADEAMIECKRQQLEDSLNALSVQADMLVGRKPYYDTGGPVPKLSLSYHLYSVTTRLLSPLASYWLTRRLARGKEDQNRIGEKLGHASLPRSQAKLVWIHATSVGEATSCLGLIEQLLVSRDDLEVLVTTTTVTAAEIMAARLPKRAFHQYAPVDLPGAVSRFLDNWRPDLAVFVESEFWPNTIVELHKRQIPAALVNGRLSARSFKRWRKFPGLIRALLARFNHISAQSFKDEQRIAALGARNTTCYGNMKVDITPAPVPSELVQELKTQIGKRTFWLAASTHRGEEALIVECHKILSAGFPDLLTIIVPRHRERADEISALINAQNLSVILRSSGDTIAKETQIYLADTLGELPLFYRLSPVSFIGGSVANVGGHNPIEAIDGGSVVLHGRHLFNFKEIYQLLNRHKAAIKIADSAGLANEVEQLLKSKKQAATIAARAKVQVSTLKGASEQTAQALLVLLDQHGQGSG